MQVFVKDLMKLGISELEAKVYLALLKKKLFTATELAKAVNIHRTQIYDVLSNLIRRGMCLEFLGSVKKYEAVEPGKVMAEFSRTLDRQKEVATGLAETLTSLYFSNFDNKDPLDFIKVLRTPATIREHVFGLIRDSEEEVKVFNKPPYSMDPDRNDPEVESLEKGVIHRCIYEVESEMETFLNRVRRFSAKGVYVRLIERLPLKMVIFDQKCVVMTLYNSGSIGSQFTAMSVEHGDFARAMTDIFERYWESSYKMEDYLAHKLSKE